MDAVFQGHEQEGLDEVPSGYTHKYKLFYQASILVACKQQGTPEQVASGGGHLMP